MSVAEVGDGLGHHIERLLGIDRHQHVAVTVLDLAQVALVNHSHASGVCAGQLNDDMGIFLGEQMRVGQDQMASGSCTAPPSIP